MRARKALALPLIAVLAVAGGLLIAGCGGSDDSSTSAGDTTLQSQNAAETSKSDEAMKHDDAMKDDSGDSMKHESGEDSMKHEGDSMKHESGDEAMKHEDEAMKHEDAMKDEG